MKDLLDNEKEHGYTKDEHVRILDAVKKDHAEKLAL